MIVNVRMKDGRTTFQFASRGDFRRVLGNKPSKDLEDRSAVVCWAKWNIEDPEWQEIKLPFVADSSVAFVVNAPSMPDYGIPAAGEAAKRHEAWEKKQAEEEGKPDGD